MNLVVQRWGNSLALRLPKAIAKDLNLECGTVVEVRSNGTELVIRRASTRYALQDMVSQINDANRHYEVTATPAKGKEVW